MFCCGIYEHVVQRSSVLQALLESQSQSLPVKLPSIVKEPDFLPWSGNDPDSLSSSVLSVSEMCAVVVVRYCYGSCPVFHHQVNRVRAPCGYMLSSANMRASNAYGTERALSCITY